MNLSTKVTNGRGVVERTTLGVAVGVFATLAMGGVQLATGQQGGIEMAFPAMYGVEGPAPRVGWAVHLFHGGLLGGLYITVVSHPSLDAAAGDSLRGGAVGLMYGLFLTLVAVGVVMPLWLSLVEFPAAPPLFGAIGTMSILTHSTYGLVLGALTPIVRDR